MSICISIFLMIVLFLLWLLFTFIDFSVKSLIFSFVLLLQLFYTFLFFYSLSLSFYCLSLFLRLTFEFYVCFVCSKCSWYLDLQMFSCIDIIHLKIKSTVTVLIVSSLDQKKKKWTWNKKCFTNCFSLAIFPIQLDFSIACQTNI